MRINSQSFITGRIVYESECYLSVELLKATKHCECKMQMWCRTGRSERCWMQRKDILDVLKEMQRWDAKPLICQEHIGVGGREIILTCRGNAWLSLEQKWNGMNDIMCKTQMNKHIKHSIQANWCLHTLNLLKLFCLTYQQIERLYYSFILQSFFSWSQPLSARALLLQSACSAKHEFNLVVKYYVSVFMNETLQWWNGWVRRRYSQNIRLLGDALDLCTPWR